MKLSGILVAFVLFSAASTNAQSLPATSNALLFTPPSQAFAARSVATFSRDSLFASARTAAALPAPAPQGVQGVFPLTYWQGYIGYSFFRFYETPQTRVNTNGAELSMAYYFKQWLAVEGEVDGGVGKQGTQTASFVFGGPGIRARYLNPRSSMELWLHGVVGGAHWSPKTSYGNEGAFGYEIGGGVDLKSRHKRFAYRVEADVLSTTFFGTYQVNPKVSAGVVCNF